MATTKPSKAAADATLPPSAGSAGSTACIGLPRATLPPAPLANAPVSDGRTVLNECTTEVTSTPPVRVAGRRAVGRGGMMTRAHERAAGG